MRSKEKWLGTDYTEAISHHIDMDGTPCIYYEGSEEWYDLINDREKLEEFEDERTRSHSTLRR